MKIGELASRCGATVETIRYYEKAGLLPGAVRDGSNYRVYGDAHLARLRLIRNCRLLDMSHDEIRTLLALLDTPDQACDEVNALIDAHIGHLDARIAALSTLRDTLGALRARCGGGSDACVIVDGLSDAPLAAQPVVDGCRHGVQ
ncbi:Cd(II)/Pb(II)-responsive transcriptional regulator [Crenobacter intestini]|uniref:Cd(II)/Pb(II)-responsive transcriptional regulator n=1 Tax=Crenobacter intestini TaxID=2563443 RepID=A0A4T0V156_9NEIS|nr:Cd(II)/Pb(II)-responsive transcriptional regulator [Crenobacter intestini]TIC85209.1 Cd(II)/Pb(II)-responsive transcriptional regulator [Crenobacter intestini]